MTPLHAQDIDQCFPDILSAAVTLAGLRRLWTAQKGGSKPEEVAVTDSSGWAERLFALACSACDDDRMHLCLIRSGQLFKDDCLGAVRRGTAAERLGFMQAAQGWNLRPGDVLISLHDHSCAADCAAHDHEFVRGVKLT